MKNTDLEGVSGELPSMFRCRYWLVFAALAVTILVLVAWGFAGRVAENVYGAGLVTGRGSYVGIPSTGSGVLLMLDVRVGDSVSCGQVIGRIYSDADRAAVERARSLMAHYKRLYEQNVKLVEDSRKAREKYSAAELKRLDDSLARQRKQLTWYEDFIKKFPALSKSGAVSKYEAADAQDRLDNRYDRIDQHQASKLSEMFACLDRIFSLEHDLFDYESAVATARETVSELENLAFDHSRIISRCTGRVVNVNVDPGDLVSVGQELVRVSTDAPGHSEFWTIDACISVLDAMKIEPGMEALVTPSVVKVEQEGSIRGFVASVGASMETLESLGRTYRSGALAKLISDVCHAVPVSVRVVLLRDPTTPSGFAWTSGRGPDLPIPHGTVASVTIRTCDHTPMSILLGSARRAMFGDGIMERDRFNNNLTSWSASK